MSFYSTIYAAGEKATAQRRLLSLIRKRANADYVRNAGMGIDMAKYKKSAVCLAVLLLLAGCGKSNEGQQKEQPTQPPQGDGKEQTANGSNGQEENPKPTASDLQREEQNAPENEKGPDSQRQVEALPPLETLFQNDFLLYNVNCASISEMSDSDKGLLQTAADQPYGVDAESGRVWGYIPQEYMAVEGDAASTNPYDSKWVLAEGVEYVDEMGFEYSFELPEGKYEVVCGFCDPFSARTVDVRAEGQEVVQGLKILKFKEIQGSFEIEVKDGELNLLVYNPNRGKDAMKNPVLSYITVRAVPEYSMELLSMLLEKAFLSEQEQASYQDKTLKEFLEKREAASNITTSAQEEELKMAYQALKEAYEGLRLKTFYHSFRPGKVWLDEEGTKIQAHGGQVQKLKLTNPQTGEIEEKWWWVGEDKTKGYRGGICAYSSDDLYNWAFEGVVMRNVTSRQELETEEYFKELYAGYTAEQLDNVYRCINDSTSVIERPKMIYNEATGKYLLWFHADGPTETSDANYAAASAGVAVSDSPYGPFRFIDRYRLNTCPDDQEDMHPQSKGMARDMNLFIDDDGTAYIIYSSEENLTIYISKLNDTFDYLCTDPKEAVYGKDFIRLYPGAQREAPAIIKKDGLYYMITSGATGWAPNQARYWVAEDIFGVWENKGDPCIGDTNRTTFSSQSTCIFAADDGTVIYMGDRWNSDNLSDSRYVWLPLSFDGKGGMSLEWQDEWELKNND